MRLSEVLSVPPVDEFVQVEGFLSNLKLNCGRHRKIDIGVIVSNYFCGACNDIRSFISTGDLYCIGADDNTVSIDCILKCPVCNTVVKKWFLVEANEPIHYPSPKVRILKQAEELSDKVMIENNCPLSMGTLLDKAQHAYYERLGAGAVIYLRKIYEQLVVKTAQARNISLKNQNNRRKKFSDLLKEVDTVAHIVPQEFAENGYRLFGELSNVLHNDYDECEALAKYKDLRRLIYGILDKIKNNQELQEALNRLGWNEENNNVQN